MDPLKILYAIIQRLLSVYHWHQITMTTAVFSFTWTWWEFAITFDNEQSRWSWIKFLFITTFDLICLAWVGYITIIDGTLQVFIADIILIIRLAAIYGRKKHVIVPVVVLYILTVAASSTVLAIRARNAKGALQDSLSTNQPLPGIYLCTLTRKLNILYAYWQVFSSWVPISVFEALIFLLAAFRVITDFKWPKGQQEIVAPSLPLSTLQFQRDRNCGTTIDTRDDGAITDQTN
ncbi:hypothetical protein F5146DRAFT_1003382 [Armillaria mellea]|nr:hypothetical protein F5146DRAFT_1003382 [Armillaria mellea]